MQKEIGWILKEKYKGKETKQFLADVKRLEAGEPVDYIIRFKEFLGCKIDLSKKPLIPRSETEFWVGESVVKITRPPTFHYSQKIRVLDIFSGSGCIGVAILKNNKKVLCDMSDADKNAVSQIKINLKNNFIKKDRYKVIQSDIFSNIKNKYDFIFANPPYIPTVKKDKIQKSVLKYEPKNALFGGEDGTFFINKFLKEAKSHLNDGGTIFMEFDGSAGSPRVPSQKKQIEKVLEKYGYISWEFNKDQYGKWRWVVVK